MAEGRIVCFGECMVELSRVEGTGDWRMGYAGDTANVAIYCARESAEVAYLTAVGSDAFSQALRAFLVAEGVADDLILADPVRGPGLYAIRTDDAGERSFTYWRDNSAVRNLFALEHASAVLRRAGEAGLLYLSGITLSLYGEAERQRIVALAAAVRAHGGEVAFDGNYRTRGWPDPATARVAFATLAAQATIALPTFEDEKTLFGDTRVEQSLERWHGWGARVVALKMGERGAIVSYPGGITQVPTETPRAARDTTGAGDAFNAAFLCALRQGANPVEAAFAGNRLAAEVVMHPGAIIQREAMPA
ncbi:sugar kinase [Leptolyngbya sp. 15MV]|nr:sugar kinase [Leptolyngbya sp. 15MV]